MWVVCLYRTVVVEQLTNSCEKKRSKKQRRKEKIYLFECRVLKNSKERSGQKIEENSRMGKTRALLKKIRDTKGIFHAKMGTIKEQKWYRPNRNRRY